MSETLQPLLFLFFDKTWNNNGQRECSGSAMMTGLVQAHIVVVRTAVLIVGIVAI